MPKFLLFCFAMFFAAGAEAQQRPHPMAHMTPEQMQQMRAGAMEMQKCMAGHQDAMQRMGEKGRAMHEEVKTLCAAGKRDDAERVAMEYGKEMAASEDVKAARKCSEMGKKMMEGLSLPQPAAATRESPKPRHICDALAERRQ